jgi:hypothetical protein
LKKTSLYTASKQHKIANKFALLGEEKQNESFKCAAAAATAVSHLYIPITSVARPPARLPHLLSYVIFFL